MATGTALDTHLCQRMFAATLGTTGTSTSYPSNPQGILHSPVTSKHGFDADGEHDLHRCLECVILCEGEKGTRGSPSEWFLVAIIIE